LIESIETLREHGPRCELARTYLALGAATASDVNRWNEARDALDQAGAIFQELGAKLDLERIDALDYQLAYGSTSLFGERSEINSRGYLHTCLFLLLVGLLALPWRPARASLIKPPPPEKTPIAGDPLASELQTRPSLPTGQVAITSSFVSDDQDQGPHLWRPLETRLVPRALLQPPTDETRLPDRLAGTCTVSSTSDSGPNTLRQCLLDAVAGDDILFDPSTFPPGTPQTITLASELPWIMVDNLTIDGSEAGVILDGNALADEPVGLSIFLAEEATIRGLQIQGFKVGVLLGLGATNCTLGGDRTVGAGPLGRGNLISANSSVGVQLEGAGTSHNSIIGNFIGTDITGDTANGNGYAGIAIAFGASQNVIGGAHSSGTCDGPCNMISGNFVGVQIEGAGTDGNQVLGNFIGTDISGNGANGNGYAGVVIAFGASHNMIGGAHSPGVCDGPCNLISGNVDLGVLIQDDGTNGNQVLGNFVGTNAAGGAALPNNQGVVLGRDATDTHVGGAGAGQGNLISGNTNLGIWISSAGTTGSQVLGNLIGTDISGITALPNYHGIIISQSTGTQIGGAATGAGNLISGNENYGIQMEYLGAPGNTVAGNKIGTNLTGTGAVPNYIGIVSIEASNNVIGGTEPGAGNLISGNAQEGLHIGSNSNLNSVLGNTIGTDVTGELAIPNVIYGVFIGFGASNNTIGGSSPGGGNLITGNGLAGVFIQNEASVGNRILGNRIGTNRTGSSSLPNGNGVKVIGALETIIGGADTSTPWVCDGPCNLISGNDVFGVSIQGVSAGAQQQASLGETDRLTVADQGNQVLGNFIGTNLVGTSALPNAAGVDLSFEATGNLIGGSNLLGEGNLISGNQREAIVVRHSLTANNQILGNRIGTTADGGSALPNGEYGIWIYGGASGNTVGGEGEGNGNLISGQAMDLGYFGVVIGGETQPVARDNQVIGNLIGTNWTGTTAIPNGGGVAVAWGASGSVIRDNVISGNNGYGIVLMDDATDNQVNGNLIGTNWTGTTAIPNGYSGVGVARGVTGSVIRDNVISGNNEHGIVIEEATGNDVRDNDVGVAADGLSPMGNEGVGIILFTAPHNMITQNSIYANIYEQIDFFEVPEPLAPAPLLTGWDGETVSGTACAGCLVEVFANPDSRPAGHTYLGTTAAAGDGTFSLNVGPGYSFLAATATDAEGTTSEFSTSPYVYLPLIVKAAGLLH